MVITLVGTVHNDRKCDERIRKIIEYYSPDVVFIEGIENWEDFDKEAAELKNYFYSKYFEKLPVGLKNEIYKEFEKEIENFKQGPEESAKDIIDNNQEVIYLDDEKYIHFRLEMLKEQFDMIGEQLLLLSSKKINLDEENYNRASLFYSTFPQRYPDEFYNLLLCRPTELKQILTKDYKIPEEEIGKCEEIIKEYYRKQENLTEFHKYVRGEERDRGWVKKIAEANPENAVSFTGLLHTLPTIENNFYNILLKKRYDVESLPLIDADNL